MPPSPSPPCLVLQHRPYAAAAAAAEPYVDVAWCLLAVLLRLRRHATPAELAARAAASSFVISPDLVRFLCQIPNSPLRLDDDGSVTISGSAVAAFAGFLFPESPRLMPRLAVEVNGRGIGLEGGGYWRWGLGRKRKGCVLAAVAKRSSRNFVARDRGNEYEEELFPSTSGRGLNSTVATEAILSYVGTTDITGSALAIPDADLEMVAFDKRAESAQLMNIHQEHSLLPSLLPSPLNLWQQKVQLCNPPASRIDRNSSAAEVSILENRTVLKTEFGFDCPENETVVKQCVTAENLSESCTGSQEGMNDAKIAVSLCCHAAETGKSHDNGVNPGTNKSDRQDVLDNGVDVDIDALKGKMGRRMESAPDSLAFDVLSTRGSDRVPSTPGKKVNAGSRNHEQRNNEGPPIEIRNKYVRKKFKSRNLDVIFTEKVAESAIDAAKDQVAHKKLPQFDSFVVEEEEGSGGYGTVYRAVRKDDGKTFAIKYPHSNAHSFHVNNELKMLERFGGRSFIIRLEGSFKSGKSECFVLEHVEHDRPEVLKREINISELQWYGYCLFKALSSLHKQGIVHRDIKPGNFLFSRKVNKGYLIDFNLALDLHHKHRLNNRYDPDTKGGFDQSFSGKKIAHPTDIRKCAGSRYPEVVGNGRNTEMRKPTLSKNLKKGADKGRPAIFPDFNGRQKSKNQTVADVSGLTSVKDATSTRTPSADRMREPLPCRGRKELLNLVHEVMRSPGQISQPPVSQRKRVPAPLGKMDKLLAFLTPMPLHLNGSPVSGSGKLKNKGNGKQKTDGACVGTKGFRAPEVLFRSPHQGCKIDMWSAGVTLLYMIIGRTPFGGDPEQNIKEIAKLKGSEDLWEVAKIHDRESSFPAELFDVHSLQSLKLRDWCEKNTKKPEFLAAVPDTLFDLVDRCLMVNPRLRMSSDEALMHDFFSPCREELKKQRVLRIARDSEHESWVK